MVGMYLIISDLEDDDTVWQLLMVSEVESKLAGAGGDDDRNKETHDDDCQEKDKMTSTLLTVNTKRRSLMNCYSTKCCTLPCSYKDRLGHSSSSGPVCSIC